MNVQIAAFNYLEHIFHDTSVGVKALLLDQQTLQFISVAMTKTELFTNEVVLIEQLQERVRKPKDPQIASLTCFCYLRPTQDNIDLLCQELRNPSFSKYALFFSNSLNDSMLHQLALSDVGSLIEACQEIFLDFSALGTRLFSLNMPDISNFRKNPDNINYSGPIIEGIFSSICSLRVRPVIRYDSGSLIATKVAEGLSNIVSTNSDLFSMRDDNALVLILDRMNDPLTPLLHFFYYLPIIHDFYKIDNNVVTVGKQYVIDERNDPQSEKIDVMYLEDAGKAIKQRIDDLEAARKEIKSAKIENMNDTTLKVLQGTNEIHFANTQLDLFNSLHERVKEEGLLDITAFEQVLSTNEDPGEHFNQFQEIVNNPMCTPKNALRLALIFALHYEKTDPSLVKKVIESLNRKGSFYNMELEYPRVLLERAGQDKRSFDIFSNRNAFSKWKKGLKSLIESQSQFELYRPPIEKIIKDLKERKLNDKQFKYIDQNRKIDQAKNAAQKVIIFIVGGATYMEHVIASENSTERDQFVVGGTSIHNADTFMQFEIEPFV